MISDCTKYHLVNAGLTWARFDLTIYQWRHQESEVGGKVEGSRVPQRGPGAEPRWESGAKPPEAEKHDKFCAYNHTCECILALLFLI